MSGSASQFSSRDPVVLNVDDFEAARYATTRVLRSAHFEVKEAGTGAEALRIVDDERPDVVLLDVNLPDMSGFEVCRRIKTNPRTARIPVLHISASSVESSQQAHGLEGGAESYLTEPVAPEVLVAAIRAALRTSQAEQAMRTLAHQWQTSFDAIGDGVALLDREGRILRWNRSLERLLGRKPAEITGQYSYRLWDPAEEPPEQFAFVRTLRTLRREEMDIRHRGRWFHVSVDPVLDNEGGRLEGAVYTVSDTTERRNLEEQFRRAQKFESIAQLAGGVAHDFNNLLTSILGNTSLVLSELPPDDRVRERLEEVVRASQRAAELTQQLLAYAGKGRFVMRRLDLSGVIRHMEDLLRASAPSKKVRLELDLAGGLPLVEADQAQMQQALVNLVINAAEAIGDGGGTIRIATRACTITEPAGDLKPGSYACLEVKDTGPGMDEHVRSRLFEPFFTTKFTGRGLGLAAVSGIVRGHRGVIEVESAPGRGAAFRLYLPAVEDAVRKPPAALPAGGVRTVLVVDDEEIVRRMAKATLEIRGYRVVLADNGQQAVDLVREMGDQLSAVLLDMTMPVMGGEEAIEYIARLRPGLRVIASSGYDRREAAQRFGNRAVGFLQKPYTSRQLAEKLREALGEPPGAA